MSGIAGVLYLDGRTAVSDMLQQMIGILAHRGPDRADSWCTGSVGFSHCMLYTTPESLDEKLPLVRHEGQLVLTADARLDNREELFALLQGTGPLSSTVADSELVLAAYEKWGEKCLDHLIGAFVFVIWDAVQQKLFCARDHMGIKPFYYYFQPGHLFAFASEIKALHRLPEVPAQLNETKIADYLISNFEDTAITGYKDIFRLPPAHLLTVDDNGLAQKEYWALDPSLELTLDTDEAYAEAFLDLFVEAVRCRVRTAVPLATMLSGGLDSSAITCVAHKLLQKEGFTPLNTFSAIFDDLPECDEREFIASVLATGEFKPHFVLGDKTDFLASLESMLWYEEEMPSAPGLFLHWELYRTAAQEGIKVILDGHDGDTVVSHGNGYLIELARNGHWLRLAQHLRAPANLYEEISYWRLLVMYWLAYGVRPWIRKRPFRRLTRFIELIQTWVQGSSVENPLTLLHPDLILRTRAGERYRESQRRQPATAKTERAYHHRDISKGWRSLGLETLDKASAAFSIETRYPFWDIRLVQFCLALPANQKIRQQWTRFVLRQGMRGIVPAKILLRQGKNDFTPNLVRALKAIDVQQMESILFDEKGLLASYINLAYLNKAAQHFRLPRATQEVMIIWRAVSLASWLKILKKKEVIPLIQKNEQKQSKKTYDAPKLTVHGDVTVITKGQSSGSFLDSSFPSGTPFGDLTFTSP